MAEVETIARKWGDSVAVVIPKNVVKEEGIRVNDRVHIRIQKEDDLSMLFGKWKTEKTPQQLKDEARKGWE